LAILLATLPIILPSDALAQNAPKASIASKGIPAWHIASPDLTADPSILFGELPNGMRYAIQKNATPKGGASIRFTIDVGARDERDDEKVAAHFMEHMAFNGSKNIPEGQLFPTLERLGLTTGVDSNADTELDHTTYKLDLPKADPASMDSALGVVREIASELTIAPAAVDRERGILIAEYQARNSPQRRRGANLLASAVPGGRLGERVDVTAAEVNAITANGLRTFYEGYYRPERATLIVVGDIDQAEIEGKIKARFSSWKAVGKARATYVAPAIPASGQMLASFVDPAATDIVELRSLSAYRPTSNSAAEERLSFLRAMASMAMNDRLLKLTRLPDSAILGGQVSFQKAVRTFQNDGIIVIAKDGQWRNALALAEQEMRRARSFGFDASEVQTVKANLDAAFTNAVAQRDAMRSSQKAEILNRAALEASVPMSPEQQLTLYRSIADTLTPQTLSDFFKTSWPERPGFVHVSTKVPIEGGQAALASALAESSKVALAPEQKSNGVQFAYDKFGPAGKIVTDKRLADSGVRTLSFANGVRLNLKKADFEPGRVMFEMHMGEGLQAFPKDKPGLAQLVPLLANDGLKAHDVDTLQRLLAGHQVSLGVGASQDTLVAAGVTTAKDLDLQFKLLAARLTNTGFRPETQTQWAAVAPPAVRAIRTTPLQIGSLAIGYAFTGNDGRYGLEDPAILQSLTLDQLKAVIEPQLEKGPVEIGLVGDFDEDKVIAGVAQTLGALPARPLETKSSVSTPSVFPEDRKTRTFYHDGAADQGVIAFGWPTTDFETLRSSVTRQMLARVISIEMMETLREKLGNTYTPSAISSESALKDGFGYLAAIVTAAPEKMDEITASVQQTMAELKKTPVTQDLLLRVRQPILDATNQAMRQNAGWSNAVAQAQSRPEKLSQQLQRADVVKMISAEDIRAAAQRYLVGEPLQVRVVPRPETP